MFWLKKMWKCWKSWFCPTNACKAPVCWAKYTPPHCTLSMSSSRQTWPLLVCPLFRFYSFFNFRIPINITNIFEVLSHILWFTNTSFSHGNNSNNINFFNNNKYFNYKSIYNNIRVGFRILDLFGIWIVKVCQIIKCSFFMPWSEYLTGIRMFQTKWWWNVWIPIWFSYANSIPVRFQMPFEYWTGFQNGLTEHVTHLLILKLDTKVWFLNVQYLNVRCSDSHCSLI